MNNFCSHQSQSQKKHSQNSQSKPSFPKKTLEISLTIVQSPSNYATKFHKENIKLIEKIQCLIIWNKGLLPIYSIAYQKLLKSTFMDIYSPFGDELKQCKASMRKLRKKIYKYSVSHKSQQKPKDSVYGIIDRLKGRQVPSFLLDSLKKRRNFELVSIKNINISEGIPMQEISSMRNHQEQQIQKIFLEHKQRMKQINEKKAATLNSMKFRPENPLKLYKRETNYSSTEEEQSSEYDGSQENSHPYFQSESHEMINAAPNHHGMQQQIDFSDLHIKDEENRLYFERNDREMYSEDIWMKFDGGLDCFINCD